MVRNSRLADVSRRFRGPVLRSRWSLPVYAFLVAFAIVMVMVTDPYSGAFADANTAPSHWAETTVGQTLATGSSAGSTSVKRDAFGSRAAPRRVNATAVAGAPSAGIPDAGSAQAIALAILTADGMGHDQYSCLVSLWDRESHWRVNAENPDGAYGIPQALPGKKMAADGPDWQTNATTQITWGLGYIQARYGTPCGAWAHSQSTGWY